MSDWVPVSERLPEEDVWVVVWLEDEDRPLIAQWGYGYRENGDRMEKPEWWDERGLTMPFTVSHWAAVDAPEGMRGK